jgi:hypothetical protein
MHLTLLSLGNIYGRHQEGKKNTRRAMITVVTVENYCCRGAETVNSNSPTTGYAGGQV